MQIFDAVMNEICTLQVYAVAYIPLSVRPLLAEILSNMLELMVFGGSVRLFAFAKSVLHSPFRGGRKKRYDVKSLLSS